MIRLAEVSLSSLLPIAALCGLLTGAATSCALAAVHDRTNRPWRVALIVVGPFVGWGLASRLSNPLALACVGGTGLMVTVELLFMLGLLRPVRMGVPHPLKRDAKSLLTTRLILLMTAVYGAIAFGLREATFPGEEGLADWGLALAMTGAASAGWWAARSAETLGECLKKSAVAGLVLAIGAALLFGDDGMGFAFSHNYRAPIAALVFTATLATAVPSFWAFDAPRLAPYSVWGADD